MTATKEQYDAAWELERQNEYPAVDLIESRFKRTIHRSNLEAAARVLACPVKVNPPNWQHGRVIFAVVCDMLERVNGDGIVTALDIGTAKGFSALMARWGMDTANRRAGHVISCDVIDPLGRARRNTVAEVDELKTLRETMAPWSTDASRIQFVRGSGVDTLKNLSARTRIRFAFVDGKHAYASVHLEATLIAMLQKVGDKILFDDVQVPDVWRAVETALGSRYSIERVDVIPGRREYALCERVS